MDYPSGNPAHAQGSIFVTHHLMQDLELWLYIQKLVMSHLNFMCCLMMNFPLFHSWGKAEYPQIGQIFCNTSHKVVHKRKLTSRTLGSLHIFREIPAKTQLTCRMITYSHLIQQVPKILDRGETSVSEVIERPVSEGVRITSNVPQVFLLNNHQMCPVGCHLAREKKDKNA